MAILSSAVNPGDDALAAQYNNLRTDLLTGDITIAGVKTFSGIPIFSAGITLSDDSSIAATKKFYLDGGNNTYWIESAGDTVQLWAGGVRGFQQTDANVDIAGTLSVTGILTSVDDFKLAATKKFYLDGGGNSYWTESSGDVIDLYVGAVQALRIADDDLTIYGLTVATEGIAPGGNENMMWDVVIFSLDGTSPDATAYVIDESKIYAMAVVGHTDATNAYAIHDEGVTGYVNTYISGDSLTVRYETLNYGSGDEAQVIIFYIA